MKAVLVLILLLSVAFEGRRCQTSNQTYAELAPNYAVNLSFLINGVDSDPAPCTNSNPGAACLPQIQAGMGNAVKISYTVNTTTPANSTSTITLKGCYGPQSTVNRAWRKPSPTIVDDKQCSVKIASGLPPAGEYKWTIGVDAVPAVYNVLALEICQGGAACSYGKSQGFFQIQAINSRPGWLMAMVGVFASLGPLCLAGFFLYERAVKKNK